MGWYEAIKDGIVVAQKQILDLVQENQKLKEENQKLLKKQEISNKIERHKDAYITLKDDEQKLIFCSNCWDSKQQLIQAQIDENGHYECPSCKVFGYYDKEKYDRIKSTESPIYVI